MDLLGDNLLSVDLLGDNLLSVDLLGVDFDDDIEVLFGEDTKSLLLDEMDIILGDKLLGVTEEVVFGFSDSFDIEIVVGIKVGVEL